MPDICVLSAIQAGTMLAPTFLRTPLQSGGSCSSIEYDTLVKQNLWWNTNLSPELWTVECPCFLLGQCAKDIGIMSTRNEDYKLTGWEEAKHLVETRQIDRFGRTPTELRRYTQYTQALKGKYGSVLYYIQHERLKWSTTEPSGDPPFTNPSDYKILYNDWPYALDPDIKHLVVWTKFAIEEVVGKEELTPEAHESIEDFVTKTFRDDKDERGISTAHGPAGIKRENIIWFKNWARLRSVHALEHFHIMLYKASPEFLQRVTQGDRPMSEALAE